MIYKTNGKNQKRTIRNLFAGLLAVICLAAFALPAGTLAETAPAAGTPISCKAARVFDGTLDSAQTLTTWEIAGHAQ